MFYKITVKDHVRVAPNLFEKTPEESVLESAKKKYAGIIDNKLGVVIAVSSIKSIGEGVIIPGDGAGYYDAVLELLTFKPELQEILLGKIKEIADFGAFITMGPLEGMIHVSQTMDDYVTFSKDKTLLGRDSKRSLKIGDTCKARIIAISFKDVTNPKIGLTMRQPGLGKIEWTQEEELKTATPEKESKETKKKKKEE